jgi:hypothetical protein
MVPLSALDPKLSAEGILTFDCPACTPDLPSSRVTDKSEQHRIRIPLKPAAPNSNGATWDHSGEFPLTLSLNPSVDVGCWHGYVLSGQVIDVLTSL